MAVDNDDLEVALRCAVTCAILAPAGERVSNHGFIIWHFIKTNNILLHACGRCAVTRAVLAPAGGKAFLCIALRVHFRLLSDTTGMQCVILGGGAIACITCVILPPAGEGVDMCARARGQASARRSAVANAMIDQCTGHKAQVLVMQKKSGLCRPFTI